MRETSQFTRRGMLLLGGAGVLGAKARWTTRDTDFWNRKQPSQWSSEEIDRLVTRSPWAKEVKASVPLPSGDIASGIGRAPTIPGVSSGRIGGMGIPGIGIPGIGGRGGQGGGSGQMQVDVIVRWESAKPILEALKTPLADIFANEYVLSVSGIPNAYIVSRDSDKPDSESAAERMKRVTFLDAKSKRPVQASVAQQAPSSFTQTLLFGFSNQALHLSRQDDEVTFVSEIGHSQFRAKFNLREMVYQDMLAV